MKPCLFMPLIVAALSLVSCGGSPGGATTPPPVTYTIGGTVAGLSGTGLVLQNNSGNNLSVVANGSFTFSNPVASGGAYNVTVLTQPSSPAQTCAPTNAGGTANADVTTVQIVCTTIAYSIGGSVSGLVGTGLVLQNNASDDLPIGANGVFTFSAPIPSGGAYAVTVLTQPSSPAQICGTANATGTASGNVTNVQLTCTNAPHNEWTWVGGSNVAAQSGVYGTQGIAAPGNIPGARESAVSWTDPSGNFWLFGGSGFNDLWKYSGGEWTWIAGSNLLNQSGIYGTQGVGSPNNTPGARPDSDVWTDASGKLWLFGGTDFSDLWRFGNGEWTWIAGPSTTLQLGTYGTLGVPAPGNNPGARDSSATWIDAAGALWLFGGEGLDSVGRYGGLNDLWRYAAGEWTWMGGSNLVNQPGSYGTLGLPDPTNIPYPRFGGVSWTDASGDFWLFGGSTFNDLWKYSAGEWTWVGGSSSRSQPGTYGIKGTPAPGNIPGGRRAAIAWTDASGNAWLLGGLGYDSTGTAGELDDLWKYSAGEWTWARARTSSARWEFTALWEPPLPPTFPEGETAPSAGSIYLGIYGSSAATAWTRLGPWEAISTICGSISLERFEAAASTRAIN